MKEGNEKSNALIPHALDRIGSGKTPTESNKGQERVSKKSIQRKDKAMSSDGTVLYNSQRLKQTPPIILSMFESPDNRNQKHGHTA